MTQYWVDLPWASYRERCGNTPEEALAKAEIEREREIKHLTQRIRWIRTVKLEVQSSSDC